MSSTWSRTGFHFLIGTLVLLGLSLPGPLQAQEPAQVTGSVTDGAGEPLRSVNVWIEGTQFRAVTNADGRYLLVVPASRAQGQEVTVHAELLGRRSASQTVTLTSGASLVADFTLTEDPLELDALVVSATGQRQLRRAVGGDVGLIDVEAMELAPVQSFDQLLQGRTSGMTVLQSSGQAGSGSRIRIRGNNSISLSNSPLIIVDGVRVNSNPNSFDLFTGGQQSSRFNDLNPEEIESIEVIRGPSASSLYGTAAANGVIQIRTRRGGADRSAWRFWARAGVTDRNLTFPENVWSVDAAGARCDNLRLASGACAAQDTTFRFNPLEGDDPAAFRTGWSQSYGTSISGGTGSTSYFLSGEWTEDNGAQIENRSDQANLRANVSGQISDEVSFSAQAGYADSDVEFPQADNSALGLLLNGLLGVPVPSVVDGQDGYRLPFEYLTAWQNFQDVSRMTLSAQLDWQPASWLAVNANGGVDDVSRHDNDIVLPGILTVFGPPFSSGFRESIKYDVLNWTGTADATASWDATESLNTSTSLGVQYFRDSENWVFASGTDLTPGVTSLAGASANFDAGESNIENITFGAYASERLSWEDRMYLNFAIRGDQNSAFGQNLGWVWYPSVSGSWVISEEDFFPSGTVLDQLRLRAAWGKSGLRPGFRDAKQFYESVTAATVSGEEAGFVIEGAGNAELEPETSSEVEVGFEVSLLNQRVDAELTYYNKESENALVDRTLAPSLGATAARVENIGAMTNEGFEFRVGGDVIQRTDLTWRLDLSGSTNDNEIESMGGVPPIVFGILGNTQEHREGFPAGGYFQRPILGFEDVNGDGLISPDEIEVGPESEFLGQPFPETEISLSTEVTALDRFTVSALLDFKGGQKLFNGTDFSRCTGASPTCEARFDPDTPLETQAAIVAFEAEETAAGFIEESDFWKLREVSLAYRAPQAWANAVRGQSLRVTVSGRNLATWTDYGGFDPEVNGSSQANYNTHDLRTLPPFRTFSLRFDVSY